MKIVWSPPSTASSSSHSSQLSAAARIGAPVANEPAASRSRAGVMLGRPIRKGVTASPLRVGPACNRRLPSFLEEVAHRPGDRLELLEMGYVRRLIDDLDPGVANPAREF